MYFNTTWLKGHTELSFLFFHFHSPNDRKIPTLASIAQLVGVLSIDQKVMGLIPHQDTSLCLSLSLSPFSSLKSISMSLSEGEKMIKFPNKKNLNICENLLQSSIQIYSSFETFHLNLPFFFTTQKEWLGIL